MLLRERRAEIEFVAHCVEPLDDFLVVGDAVLLAFSGFFVLGKSGVVDTIMTRRVLFLLKLRPDLFLAPENA
ncbi:MAG: hypothetical protein V3T49_00095 [Dehalococcoidia bacterium]